MLPYFFYRKGIVKTLPQESDASQLSETTPVELNLKKIYDMVLFGFGIASVSFSLGYFFGMSADSKSVLYLFMISIVIGLFSAIGFKIDFKNGGTFTLGSEGKTHKEINGSLLGSYIVILCLCIFLGSNLGRFSIKNDFSIFNQTIEVPFKNDSLKLDYQKTKQWMTFVKTLRDEGYSNCSIENLTSNYVSSFNSIDSLSKKNKILKDSLNMFLQNKLKTVQEILNQKK